MEHFIRKSKLEELFNGLNETNRNYMLGVARALIFAQDNMKNSQMEQKNTITLKNEEKQNRIFDSIDSI